MLRTDQSLLEGPTLPRDIGSSLGPLSTGPLSTGLWLTGLCLRLAGLELTESLF
jgi:hypothetical protein